MVATFNQIGNFPSNITTKFEIVGIFQEDNGKQVSDTVAQFLDYKSALTALKEMSQGKYGHQTSDRLGYYIETAEYLHLSVVTRAWKENSSQYEVINSMVVAEVKRVGV